MKYKLVSSCNLAVIKKIIRLTYEKENKFMTGSIGISDRREVYKSAV